jgi:hypothetical protein
MIFGLRSGLVAKKTVKTIQKDEPKAKEKGNDNTDAFFKKASKDDPKSNNVTGAGKDKIDKKDQALLANFHWNYNPISLFIRSDINVEDPPGSKFMWQDKTDPHVKIVLLRHSQTPFNIDHDTIMGAFMRKKMGKLMWAWKFSQLKKCEKPGFINAPLTDAGIKMARDAGVKFREQYPNIKRIVISPMRRTIQTLEYLMEDYPGFKENQIPVEFMVEMRESLTSSCDIGCWTEDEFEGIQNLKRYCILGK